MARRRSYHEADDFVDDEDPIAEIDKLVRADLQNSPLNRFWQNIWTRVKPVIGFKFHYLRQWVVISEQDWIELFRAEREYFSGLTDDNPVTMDTMLDVWNESCPSYSKELKPGQITFLHQPLFIVQQEGDTSKSRTLH